MKRKFYTLVLCLLLSVTVQAQRIVFEVIAKVPYDPRSQQYGKMEPREMKIIKKGDDAIYIGADKYDVVEVDERKNDGDVQYVQYTAVDAAGAEWTIKVCHGGTVEHEVMRNYVLLFNNTQIYDWTYYFTDAGVLTDK